MKIFVDAYLLNKEYQGTRTYIVELYKELSRKRKDIKITFGVVEQTTEIMNEFLEFDNISLYEYKEKNRWKRMFGELPKLSFLYDYMHFQYIIPFRKLNENCQYINTIHDILFVDYPNQFPFFYRISRTILFKWSAKKTDILLTVSNYSKKQIAKHFNIQLTKILVTPNGVNEEFLEDYDKKRIQEKILSKYGLKDYILYVSRVEPRKNQLQLLQLFSNNQSIYNNYTMVFVGKKSLESNSFEEYFMKLPDEVKNKVKYIEQVPQDDLVDFYRSASFFIYPSLYEGFGIPPIEAAAAKIPVLCNNMTAMEDFTFFEPYLINFEHQNIQQCFDDFILNNQSDIKGIKKEIESNYAWSTSADDLLNVLK
ncbi:MULTISPECIES: glycosyltransferase family 4 protein [Empedobacter]|uniref:Glycosyltransferase family 4 protein n=1 Tax=Empedobacter falsenii TaxID=343874 RepID=A0A7H9DX52_9FLAO|nr:MULTISPECIES: glycosyltransferase family 1 protein [Empedobacter]MDH2207356.1 glycosyltransferase family 4 protein [Empedobacter sp. GD03644]QLL59700.1 glycosyltransferase family 4 protein [Empedobacter falsenii]